MKKFFSQIFIISLFFWLVGKPTFAICPLCTIAVGAGVGLSRWLGIDDLITGLWIGGLTVSLINWTIDWLNRKKVNFVAMEFIVYLAYYLLIILPLHYTNIIHLSYDLKDHLLLGIIVGSFAFYCGASWYFYLKEKNNGHAHFPYEKIVFPVAPLIILSILFYFLTK